MRNTAFVMAGILAGLFAASCDGGPVVPSADQLSYDQGWDDGFNAGQSSCPLPDVPELEPCPECPSESDIIEEFLNRVSDECHFGSSLADNPRGTHDEVMNRLWDLHRRGHC